VSKTVIEKLVDCVAPHINERDPMGLFKRDRTINEYETEIECIAASRYRMDSNGSVALVVSEVFRYWFEGIDKADELFSVMKCWDVATKIYAAILKHEEEDEKRWAKAGESKSFGS